jgi:hypothetical protein
VSAAAAAFAAELARTVALVGFEWAAFLQLVGELREIPRFSLPGHRNGFHIYKSFKGKQTVNRTVKAYCHGGHRKISGREYTP